MANKQESNDIHETSTGSATTSTMNTQQVKRYARQRRPIVSVELQDKDVLMGRGKSNHQHPGNQRFVSIVQSYVPPYQIAMTKVEKSNVIRETVRTITEEGARFLRFDTEQSCWHEASYFTAMAKTGQALRYIALQIDKLSSAEDDMDKLSMEDSVSNEAPTKNEPLLSNKEILAAVGYHLDEATNIITPMEPSEFASLSSWSDEDSDSSRKRKRHDAPAFRRIIESSSQEK
jgi:hypothetical protein